MGLLSDRLRRIRNSKDQTREDPAIQGRQPLVTGLIILGLSISAMTIPPVQTLIENLVSGRLAAGLAATILAVEVSVSRIGQPDMVLTTPDLADEIDDILNRRREAETS